MRRSDRQPCRTLPGYARCRWRIRTPTLSKSASGCSWGFTNPIEAAEQVGSPQREPWRTAVSERQRVAQGSPRVVAMPARQLDELFEDHRLLGPLGTGRGPCPRLGHCLALAHRQTHLLGVAPTTYANR